MRWQKLISREGVDLTSISGFDPVFIKHIKEFTNSSEELFFTVFQHNTLTHYVGVDPQQWCHGMYTQYLGSPQQIKQYHLEGGLLLRDIKATTKKWSAELNPGSPAGAILNAFNDFAAQYKVINYTFSIGYWLAIEGWQDQCAKIISSLVTKQNLQHRQEKILSSVYKPWKKTALIEIQDKLRKGVKPKELAEEYQFLRSWSAVWFRPIDEEWIKNLGSTPIKEEQQETYTTRKLITLLQPTPEERYFLEIAPYVVFLKDWRDDLRRSHVYSWSFLFDLLAAKFKIARDDLGYLSLQELTQSIGQGTIDMEKVTRRKRYPCIITADAEGTIKILDGGIPRQYNEIITAAEREDRKQTIKGLTAYGGKVTGKVRIIESYHDLKKVQKEDILVANTTHPTYLPAMRQAAAFVTNEGGLTSHAAIVSREMKVPCIVGTRIATKILHNGDFVEVDATRGIVRKIEKY